MSVQQDPSPVDALTAVQRLESSLEERSGNEQAQGVMEPGPSTFRPSVPHQEMLDYKRRKKLTATIITTAEGILVGALRRDDLEPTAIGNRHVRRDLS